VPYESEKFAVPEAVTANFVYVRLRKDDYSAEERAEIAQRGERLKSDGRDVFVFFKHEETPAGAFYSEGWQHVRTAGSHRIFKHVGKAKLVTVAGKPGEDVPTGTLRAILKDSELESK